VRAEDGKSNFDRRARDCPPCLRGGRVCHFVRAVVKNIWEQFGFHNGRLWLIWFAKGTDTAKLRGRRRQAAASPNPFWLEVQLALLRLVVIEPFTAFSIQSQN
jgi:hypothetical protein